MRYLVYAIAFILLAYASCQQDAGSEKVNLTATEVKELIESGQEIVVLDVRTPHEFQDGHVEGAINTDYTSPGFEQEIAQLDKSATYLLYCKSGNRSERAAAVMTRRKFNNLYNSSAGFDKPKAAGIPTR